MEVLGGAELLRLVWEGKVIPWWRLPGCCLLEASRAALAGLTPGVPKGAVKLVGATETCAHGYCSCRHAVHDVCACLGSSVTQAWQQAVFRIGGTKATRSAKSPAANHSPQLTLL